MPLACRGYRVLCVELGENLAAVARRNLASYSRTEVLTADFEEWSPPKEAFDLAISATASHWLDPSVAYPKVARLLEPGGAIALFWNEHVHSDASGGFFEAVQRVYEREAPEIVKSEDERRLPRPEEVPDRTGEIEGSGVFEGVTRRLYRWDETYDTDEGYLRVLNTSSGHRGLTEATRGRLFRAIAGLIDGEHDGRIVKGYLTTLYVARRGPSCC